MTLKESEIGASSGPSTENVEDAKMQPAANPDEDAEFSYKEQRKIIHRIDRRLVVMLGLIYCVSLVDRTNLSNAAIAGMTAELELDVGFRYASPPVSIFPRSPLTNTTAVHYRSRLLHHLRGISAPGHDSNQKDWSQNIPPCPVRGLGYHHGTWVLRSPH